MKLLYRNISSVFLVFSVVNLVQRSNACASIEALRSNL